MNSSKLPPNLWKFQVFQEEFFQKPSFSMVWGDVGTGKTTCALGLANRVLFQQQKVFFLYTKQEFPQDLFQRMLGELPQDAQDQLTIWQVDSFRKQTEIVLNWLFQIQSLTKLLGYNPVGLIVVDEITALYLIELKTDKKSDELNQKFTLQLATLAYILKQYQIPILILNQFTTKKNEDDSVQDVPHGGKILTFWTELEIKLERTAQFSRILCHSTKNMNNLNVPNESFWVLAEKGFI